MRRHLVAPLLAVATAFVLVGCSDRPEPGPGEARLRSLRGTVEVSRDGRTWRPAEDELLHRGDRVRVRGVGSALLGLNSGGSLELRRGSHVVVGSPVGLVAGDLLVDAGRSHVTVGDSVTTGEVARNGAARFTRGLALDVRTYAGVATLRSAGRSLDVPAYRQASVGGTGLVPGRPQPLRYGEDDVWDRRYLGEWIDLGRDLETRSRGLTGQLAPGQGETPGFYELLLPGLTDEEFEADLLAGTGVPTSPGERLIGAVIAVSGEGGTFTSRWREVFSFRDEGAEWGLVAADQRVDDPADLLIDVDQALARAVVRPELAAVPAVVTSPPLPPPPPVTSGGRPPSSPGASAPPTAPPPTTGPTVTAPTTDPPVITVPIPTFPPPAQSADGPQEEDHGPIALLADGLVDTLGGVLDQLLQPTPPSP